LLIGFQDTGKRT